MTDVQVLAMPARRFWLMNDNIDRVLAQEDMRELTLLVSAQGKEAYEEHRKRLVMVLDEVVQEDDEHLDRDGLNDLRALNGKAFG